MGSRTQISSVSTAVITLLRQHMLNLQTVGKLSSQKHKTPETYTFRMTQGRKSIKSFFCNPTVAKAVKEKSALSPHGENNLILQPSYKLTLIGLCRL